MPNTTHGKRRHLTDKWIRRFLAGCIDQRKAATPGPYANCLGGDPKFWKLDHEGVYAQIHDEVIEIARCGSINDAAFLANAWWLTESLDQAMHRITVMAAEIRHLRRELKPLQDADYMKKLKIALINFKASVNPHKWGLLMDEAAEKYPAEFNDTGKRCLVIRDLILAKGMAITVDEPLRKRTPGHEGYIGRKLGLRFQQKKPSVNEELQLQSDMRPKKKRRQ